MKKKKKSGTASCIICYFYARGGGGGGGGRAGGTWVTVYWVCAAGLSEPLPHYSLFCGQLCIDPILATFGQICNFRDPNSVTFYFYELTHFLD